MTAVNSTKARPQKPYPEFPLFAHNNGQWCRKIAGKLHSFGTWDDPNAALKNHNDNFANLKEGLEKAEDFDGCRVADVINEYLSVQEDRLELGEIQQVTFDSLKYVGQLIVEFIPKTRAVDSLTPKDFRKLRTGMMKRYAPTNTRVNMSRVRSIFKFAYEERMITIPVFFGRGFDAPTKAMIRKARNEKPKKLFDPCQITLLLANASPAMKAMILLSINTGMNNADLGNVLHRHIDLKTGWMDYPRHKTGIQRRAKLWPETITAIEKYLDERQTPLLQFQGFVFITKARRKWGHSSLPSEFAKLRDAVNFDDAGKEYDPPPIPHGSFGYFRHTFETVAGGSRDQVAVNAVMGHVDDSMAAEYRECIEDDRLEAVATHVRRWLFGKRVAK